MNIKRWVLASMLLVACNGDGNGDATSDGSGTDGGEGTAEGTADGNDTVADSTGGDTAAESSDDDGTTGGPTTGDTADGDSSSDSGSDDGVVDPTPILERDPMITHVCTETRALAEIDFGGKQSRAEGLLAHNGEFSLLIAEGPLELRQLGLDGVIGDTFAVATQPSYRRPIAIATDAGIALVWSVPGMTEGLRFALVDANQQFVVGPVDIPGTTSDSSIASALVPDADGGYALFYGMANNTGDTQLWRTMLDANGGTVGSAVEIADIGTTWATAPASAVATPGGGQALAFTAGGYEGFEVFFVELDAAGTALYEPNRISREAGEGWSSDFSPFPRRNVIAVGGEYWVAHTESYADYEQMEGHTNIKLAVVGDEGQAQVHTLQAPTEDVEHRWPSFTEIDGQPALTWTTGTIIWVCAGCIGDHDLNLVVLDPDTIVPASEPVTQATSTNGVIAPLVAVDGGDILSAGSLDYHAATLAATGAMQCTATD